VGQLAQRLTVEDDICFTGGVALNGGVVRQMKVFLEI
jgi:activator of 2-hydroxyglutaryl-CoA dehydratase